MSDACEVIPQCVRLMLVLFSYYGDLFKTKEHFNMASLNY